MDVRQTGITSLIESARPFYALLSKKEKGPVLDRLSLETGYSRQNLANVLNGCRKVGQEKTIYSRIKNLSN